MTERDLIERARNGDRAAEREIYDGHVDRIYRLAYRMCGRADLAEDFVQETFVKAFGALDGFRGEAALSTWLHSIATRVVLNGTDNVALDGDWVKSYDKSANDPSFDCIDYGAIALRRSVLSDIADGAVWGVDALFRKLARTRKLRALVVPERFYEVGSPEGLSQLERHLASEQTHPSEVPW